MSSFQRLLKFIDFTHQLQQVQRIVHVRHEERKENDMEHMYQLSMVAWYIAEEQKLPFDKNKIIAYALVHDVVEGYAGDTFFYHRSAAESLDKAKREAAAIEKLKIEFPEFTQLHQLIHAYESRADPESRFVYALDKVLPVINIYLDNGRTWKEHDITLQMLVDGKKNKVAVSPEIKPYFDELIALLEKGSENLFPPKK